MKKIIFLMTLILLCSSLAFAVNGPAGRILPQPKMVEHISTIKGLENAMLKVPAERIEHLNQVMERILDHRIKILNKLENIEIEEDENGEIQATGKRDALFLGAFKFKRNIQYNIDEEGNVNRIRAWHEFLWKFQGEVD